MEDPSLIWAVTLFMKTPSSWSEQLPSSTGGGAGFQHTVFLGNTVPRVLSPGCESPPFPFVLL